MSFLNTTEQKELAREFLRNLRQTCNVAFRDNVTGEWWMFPSTQDNLNSAPHGGVHVLPQARPESEIATLGYEILDGDPYPLAENAAQYLNFLENSLS